MNINPPQKKKKKKKKHKYKWIIGLCKLFITSYA